MLMSTGSKVTQWRREVPELPGRAYALCVSIEEMEEDETPNIDALDVRVRAVRECVTH